MKKLLLIFLLMPLWCIAQITSYVKTKNGDTIIVNRYGDTLKYYGTGDIYIYKQEQINAERAEYEKLKKQYGKWHIPKGTKIDTVPIRIRPTEPELAEARSDIIVPASTYKKLSNKMWEQTALIDSLQKELFKCQEEKTVDKSTIKLLFETLEIYKKVYDKITVPTQAITLPSKTYTSTFDSLGNIYFKEK